MIRYDAIVVGTGFGGAVVGTRLAQSGMRVLFLEHGPWWGPAAADVAPSVGRALPRGWWGSLELLRNLRFAGRHRSADVRANVNGLYELHRFPALTVLGASGVGGGSHVYAAIQCEPNAGYWDDFPPEITSDEMAPYFAKVRDVQRPSPAPPLPLRRLSLSDFNTLVSIIHRGKEFQAGRGVNLWMRDGRWAWFTVNCAGDHLHITYDLPQNPGPVRRIVSEVRSQTPNRQLCRLSIQTRTCLRPLLYFTLEPRR